MKSNNGWLRGLGQVLSAAGLAGLCCTLLPACAAKKAAPPRPTARLSGTVQIAGGKAVAGGTVRLDFGARGIATTAITPQGSFSFGNLPVGTARISVETQSVQKPAPAAKEPEPALAMAEAFRKYRDNLAKTPGAQDKTAHVPIMQRYADFQTSGLTIELNAGRNHKNIIVE